MYAPAIGAWFGGGSTKGPADDPYVVSIKVYLHVYVQTS